MTAFNHQKYAPFEPVVLAQRQWPDRVITQAPQWCSVDLRDGNQALIEPMNVAQKQRLFELLVAMGFKEIEIGFPAASQPDFDFVRWIIEERGQPEGVTLQVLVQARQELVEKTFAALQGASRAIVHVYNSTSVIQRERVFGQGRDGIKAIAVAGAEMLQREAAKYPETEWVFQYSPESFSGTEVDYAVEVCEAVMDVWQPTAERPCIINLPATVEMSTPNRFADQVEYFVTHIRRREAVRISVHTHNDRGCAVAASELAVLAGADRVEGTLLGNGERTGNMDIVTMAMNLYSQGIDPELDLSRVDEILQVSTECTGIEVHPRHPWVGELVYTAFSGSHQDAIRKCLHLQGEDEPWQVAYLPIDPRDLGRDYQAVIRVNSQSGKGGMAYVLERDYGLNIPRWMQLELATHVQREAEQCGGELSGEQIYRVFTETFMSQAEPWQLQGYQLSRQAGQEMIQVQVSRSGEVMTLQGSGNGVLSAFCDALQGALGESITVVDYSEHSLGHDSDAQAAAYVQVSVAGQRSGAAALDSDVVSAGLKAVVAGLNRLA